MEDTESIFWSNIEAGLSLLAVNLPSLWAYVNKVSPERIIASIRSAISLRSLRSGGSSNLSRSHVRIPENTETAAGTQDRIVAPQKGAESYAMQDVEGKLAVEQPGDKAMMAKETSTTSVDEMV